MSDRQRSRHRSPSPQRRRRRSPTSSERSSSPDARRVKPRAEHTHRSKASQKKGSLSPDSGRSRSRSREASRERRGGRDKEARKREERPHDNGRVREGREQQEVGRESRGGSRRHDAGFDNDRPSRQSSPPAREQGMRAAHEDNKARLPPPPPLPPRGPGSRGDNGTQGHAAPPPPPPPPGEPPNEHNGDERGGKPGKKAEVQPDFGYSGKLAEETNKVKGVVMKYNEPPEACKPDLKWRLYVFKNGELFGEPFYIHRQSWYMFGRERRIVDIPTDHPSCSKQHGVIQFRVVERADDWGVNKQHIVPYLMDLNSINGTFLNGERIESARYYELRERDMLKFGLSSREYVLLHDKSDM